MNLNSRVAKLECAAVTSPPAEVKPLGTEEKNVVIRNFVRTMADLYISDEITRMRFFGVYGQFEQSDIDILSLPTEPYWYTGLVALGIDVHAILQEQLMSGVTLAIPYPDSAYEGHPEQKEKDIERSRETRFSSWGLRHTVPSVATLAD